MASPAQCLANAENAQHSTGPNTTEGKAKVAKNGVRHGLFTAYERLAPEQSERINQLLEELHLGFPQQCPAMEEIILRYALAKWRSDLYLEMEASFFSAAVVKELQNPETAALAEENGGNIVLGLALQHDSEGPRVFAKLLRYGSQVTRELNRTSDAYDAVVELLEPSEYKTKPIPPPRADHPRSETPEQSEPDVQTPRNAPCPCGSGAKYKRCCGIAAPAVTGEAQARIREIAGQGI